MASFDFIEASAKGYEFSWYERSYLMRAAVPVVLVKLASILIIRFMHIEDQSLLSGLITMPAHVIEALFMVSVVRFIAFREPLFEFSRVMGGRPPPDIAHDDKAAMGDAEVRHKQDASVFTRVAMFKAGVAMYLLIKIVQLGFIGAMLDYGRGLDPGAEVPAPEQNLANALVFMALTGALLWAFRLVWLYIPMAMGYTVSGFLKRIKGMMSSLSIFATWFVTFFPLMVLISGIFMLSSFVFVSETILQLFIYDVIRVFGETLIILVQTVAMTFGFIEVLTNQNKKE
ncbi:MAG: hypothetical protein KAJ29_03435 [Alphaproteobacteria bacterium]|nr:hypothetical protein [Alphaproteobacteria bacterium]